MSAPRIRRIVVALDASEPSVAAAETAAEIAAALAVGLAGLFVEDDALLRLAGHPWAAQIDALSAERRTLDRDRLELDLRAQAERARRRLEAAARRRGATWNFAVRRGGVDEEILGGLEPGDLVAMGRVGWGGGRALGGTARALLARGPGGVLLLPRSPAPIGAIAALCDGGAAALAALEVAAQLAASLAQPLRLLIPLELADPAAVERVAGEVLAGIPIAVEIRRVAHDGLPDAISLPSRGSVLLVLPAGFAADEERAVRLVEALETPILVLR